ncbi:patatin-like phospholipase family protein [Microbulbifer sp. OS29]|uniref:Patatin-like phospholipase family protein n=1 Tax=Microbulbifer okhotskensis TaxID=2926617 RepID=A0A9X2ENB1_9GAMM|nr:patatin-like phospholipase family protein [Microbulbifer okhotskensis]MCO1335422.1 patatin-like phospholipase family protein [Microbulbifer okhotskensis]
MFNQMVFGGGGSRCTWQLGFLLSVERELPIRPSVVCAASGGSMVAGLMLMDRCREGADYFHSVCKKTEKNFYWNNSFRKDPIFPHFEIYKKGVHELFHDSFEHLHQTSDLRIAVTYPPEWLPTPIALTLGLAIFYSNKHLFHNLHPMTALNLGFRQLFHPVRQCKNSAEIEQLILSSCCAPPISPRLSLHGAEVLDGALVGNAPVAGLEAGNGRVLILDTGHFSNLPNCFSVQKGGQVWTYVQPSRPLPIGMWNFTNPNAMRHTLNIGLTDGNAFLEVLLSGKERLVQL